MYVNKDPRGYELVNGVPEITHYVYSPALDVLDAIMEKMTINKKYGLGEKVLANQLD